MILGIARDPYLSAIRSDLLPFRHCVFSIVRPLRLDRGSQNLDHTRHVRLVEHHNMIDASECGQQRDTFIFVENGPAWILDRSYGPVAVDGHDESIAQSARSFKVAQMSDVQNVEAAICKNDLLSFKQWP